MTTASNHKPDILFVLSVDTEEEWDWEGEFPQENFSVENSKKIPDFHKFCRQLGIRPTYFIDYAVASDQRAAGLIRPFLEKSECEIGAHLHPWSNPPYFGYSGERESHVINLPIEQVEQKLDCLLNVIKSHLGVLPNAFRTGRWGINGEVLTLLRNKGFTIDSSMYPFFRNHYFNCEETCLKPYWPDFDEPMYKGNQRDIIELPVTVGFNHQNYQWMFKLYKSFSHSALQSLRLTGIAWQTRMVRKLYFSPEVTSGADMKPLVDFALNNGHPVLHMYLHSSSLIDGATGLMQGTNNFTKICNNIKEVIDYAQHKAHLHFCTISEAATLVKNRTGIVGKAL